MPKATSRDLDELQSELNALYVEFQVDSRRDLAAALESLEGLAGLVKPSRYEVMRALTFATGIALLLASPSALLAGDQGRDSSQVFMADQSIQAPAEQ